VPRLTPALHPPPASAGLGDDGWPAPGTAARRLLDARYWGDDHLRPRARSTAESYGRPYITGWIVDWKGGEDEDAVRCRAFAAEWRTFRRRYGDSLAARRRRRVLEPEPDAIGLGTNAFARYTPGPDAPARSRPAPLSSGRAASRGGRLTPALEARRRRGTPDPVGAVAAFMATPAYQAALAQALHRNLLEGWPQDQDRADEALLVGGPSDGARVPLPEQRPHTLYTVSPPAAIWSLGADDPVRFAPPPQNEYRGSGVRLPDGTLLFAYVPRRRPPPPESSLSAE
jgi:hypothetical protein